jgi:hypothetical protein
MQSNFWIENVFEATDWCLEVCQTKKTIWISEEPVCIFMTVAAEMQPFSPLIKSS